MPGAPATSPNFTIPRFSNADEANFALQVNSVVDAVDANVDAAIDAAIAAAVASLATVEAWRVVGAGGQPAYTAHDSEPEAFWTGNAAFYKKGEVVRLRGWAHFDNDWANAPPHTMFVLPAGYRPATTLRFPCANQVHGIEVVTVDPAGAVAWSTVTSGVFGPFDAYLDSISFRVA